MNKTTKLVSTTIIGLTVIGITVTIFFLGATPPLVRLDSMALAFILISEIAIFGCLLFLLLSSASSGKQIVRIGILSVLGIHWLVTVLFAFLRGAYSENPNNFITVNLILIGISAVLCILINVFSSYVQNINEKSSKVNVNDQAKKGGF